MSDGFAGMPLTNRPASTDAKKVVCRQLSLRHKVQRCKPPTITLISWSRSCHESTTCLIARLWASCCCSITPADQGQWRVATSSAVVRTFLGPLVSHDFRTVSVQTKRLQCTVPCPLHIYSRPTMDQVTSDSSILNIPAMGLCPAMVSCTREKKFKSIPKSVTTGGAPGERKYRNSFITTKSESRTNVRLCGNARPKSGNSKQKRPKR